MCFDGFLIQLIFQHDGMGSSKIKKKEKCKFYNFIKYVFVD
jgi:hypothetical protein